MPINSEHPKGQESLVMWVGFLIYLLIQTEEYLVRTCFYFHNMKEEKRTAQKSIAIPTS
jgi:hypothetical protein